MSKMVTFGRIANEIEFKLMNNEKKTPVVEFSIPEKLPGSDNSQFLNFVAFGKNAENIEKYFYKGSRIVVYSHPVVQEYTNKDGQKVRLVKFYIDSFEFVDTKAESEAKAPVKTEATGSEGFMNVPDDAFEGTPFA